MNSGGVHGEACESGPFVCVSATRWGRLVPEAVRRGARLRACWPGVGRLEGLSAISSKWFLPTRLETRTKESKTNASVVVEKPTREMKVIDAKHPAASTDFFLLEEV